MEKIIDPKADRKIADAPKNNIPGWGFDADPDNDPTYPIKHRNGADYERINYEKPPQQPVNIEILHSIERPGITRVFGTSTPPSGLSGMIRRFAFRYSESTYSHWVPLVLADRVDVIQGIIDDLKHGHVPNIFAEKGWNAEWKFNRKGLIRKLAVSAVITAGIIMLLSGKNKARR
ncbi:MAG TPA: hypothetical protein VGO09_05070 [Flavisolibacter sp.]|jgi:hypothetical protein|nr:hypothetical protein [Flavisolibacter sp.]